MVSSKFHIKYNVYSQPKMRLIEDPCVVVSFRKQLDIHGCSSYPVKQKTLNSVSNADSNGL